MKLAVLFTGGKDSALALHRVIREGNEIKHLVAVIPLREDSWMFHYPNIGIVDLFQETTGIPVAKAESSGLRNEEVQDLRRLVEGLDVDGLVAGSISSTYQKTRIEKVCKALGIKCITPLWHEDELKLLGEIVKLGFHTVITGVYARGLEKAWLGRRINRESIGDLLKLRQKYGISLAGEGGEYETLVVDAPFFKRRIRIQRAEKLWDGQSGYYRVVKAETIAKGDGNSCSPSSSSEETSDHKDI